MFKKKVVLLTTDYYSSERPGIMGESTGGRDCNLLRHHGCRVAAVRGGEKILESILRMERSVSVVIGYNP